MFGFFIDGAIGLAIIILASALAKALFPRHGRSAYRASQPQANPAATKALETYERLAREKLEVIKTALTMGYGDEELKRLDDRLEKLIGKEKLAAIMRGEGTGAMADADLLDTRLDHELERLKQLKQKQ